MQALDESLDDGTKSGWVYTLQTIQDLLPSTQKIKILFPHQAGQDDPIQAHPVHHWTRLHEETQLPCPR